MIKSLTALIVCLVSLSMATAAPPTTAPPTTAPRATENTGLVSPVATEDSKQRSSESLAEICKRFQAFDQNSDGAAEIRSLHPIASAGDASRRVLLLVEQRLLEPLEGAEEIAPYCERWAADLAKEGFRADVVAVDLAPSKLHQDGRYVLALREFLRAVNHDRSLSGVLMVGHFPDAFLVRTINWRKRGSVTFHKGSPKKKTYNSVRYLRRAPEPIARRADIVLADLDGRWEDVYVQPKTKFESVSSVLDPKDLAEGGPCVDLQRSSKSFEDVFHISDGRIEIHENESSDEGAESKSSFTIKLIDDEAGHECGELDRKNPNVIARPDIIVSRVDARGVALRPRENIVGVDGKKLLDESGEPQTVQFASKKKVPHWSRRLWEADPVLERKLLADFFERNHDYRTGAAEVAWRPSSIACDLRSGYRTMRRASAEWDESNRSLADIRGRPTLEGFVEWVKYPAILRTLRAHSNPLGSQFKKTNPSKLDDRLDGPAWSWTQKGDRLEPSLVSACKKGQLNWFLLRSLWENNQVATEPCFYHHTGCDGISPYGASKVPFNHRVYGQRQTAEALLLFGNGLALVGRAKTYYDEPRGFTTALRDGETFGAAWARYFEIESKAKSYRYVGGDIGRKRSYFWSVLGDWTLTLKKTEPQSVSKEEKI